jgi:adenosine deaminase
MRRILPLGCFFILALASACDSGDTDETGPQTGGSLPIGGSPSTGGTGGVSEGGAGGSPSTGGAGGVSEGGTGGEGGGPGPTCDGTPAECAEMWEEAASDRFDMLVGGPQDQLEAFLMAVPKGGDLHNHLSGAVYAETFLDWAENENFCINSTTYAASSSSNCGGATQAVPTSGAFYDAIIGAWSMEGFMRGGAETGHDHFFNTFGKFGQIAGAHRFDSIADVAIRAANENQVYVETMFNMGQNVGTLTDDNWVGTLNIDDLQEAYDLAVNDPTFSDELDQDINVPNQARTGYRNALGCSGSTPPAACDVEVRFTAQVSRLGSRAQIFGQLIGAFEMAMQTDAIVGVNLSSPEDEVSDGGYDLQMAMLDFLYQQYTETGLSPIRVTLHAGELTETYGTPNGLAGNLRKAVEVAHAERIGHGLTLLSDSDPQGLMEDMRDRGVLVEVCLSSNEQILLVNGSDHPLATYLDNQVPVALATDDQGVSRSSMAGEYLRAALDQALSYRQLKLIARNSLEHAFVPGDSLWTSVIDAEPVAACASNATMGVGDPPDAACEAFLAGSVRATLQWRLEHNFREFESQQ